MSHVWVPSRLPLVWRGGGAGAGWLRANKLDARLAHAADRRLQLSRVQTSRRRTACLTCELLLLEFIPFALSCLLFLFNPKHQLSGTFGQIWMNRSEWLDALRPLHGFASRRPSSTLMSSDLPNFSASISSSKQAHARTAPVHLCLEYSNHAASLTSRHVDFPCSHPLLVGANCLPIRIRERAKEPTSGRLDANMVSCRKRI